MSVRHKATAIEKVPYKKLLAEMVVNGDNYSIVAQVLNCSIPLIEKKMRAETDWKKREIDILMERYHKKYEELF